MTLTSISPRGCHLFKKASNVSQYLPFVHVVVVSPLHPERPRGLPAPLQGCVEPQTVAVGHDLVCGAVDDTGPRLDLPDLPVVREVVVDVPFCSG